ncbi:hypothetical protein FZC78_22395 [Rossellomorea vietnamensis]|uniref:Uncharacterized protein n=1 Tax=Rossellomorea vietnamensis TaxID=218284 RepID=A0A5D4NFN1_9BACI|nr:hypothetical protein [Rossellomorea vietnamensis]TYS13095.1 hypothetical protein FZC78_22395 [Rossellomorea vietnamensis]
MRKQPLSTRDLLTKLYEAACQARAHNYKSTVVAKVFFPTNQFIMMKNESIESIFKATLTNPADVTSTNWCGYTIYSAYPLEIFSCTAENNPDLNFLMAGYIVDGDLSEMSNMDILTTIADHSGNVEEWINNLNDIQDDLQRSFMTGRTYIAPPTLLFAPIVLYRSQRRNHIFISSRFNTQNTRSKADPGAGSGRSPFFSKV